MAQSNLSKMALLAAIDAIEADTPDARLDTLEEDFATAQGDITTLQTDLDTAEGDIGTLQTDVSNAQGEITALEGDLLYAALTPGAEGADNIAVAVQIKDYNDASISAVTSVLFELVDASMVSSLSAAFTLAETGAGAEVSTTARAALLVTTDANGVATVTAHDVNGASGATVYLKATVLNGFGRVQYTSLTFDGA